jgi:hypothetical protein
MTTEQKNLWTFSFSSAHSSTSRLPNPPGFGSVRSKDFLDGHKNERQAASKNMEDTEALLEARSACDRALNCIDRNAWELSWSPIKTMGMHFVMLYFAGFSGNIFSILILCHVLMNAISTLFQVKTVFQPLQKAYREKLAVKNSLNKALMKTTTLSISDEFLGSSLFWQQKIIFISITLSLIGYLIRHAVGMGVLPSYTDVFTIQKIQTNMSFKPKVIGLTS